MMNVLKENMVILVKKIVRVIARTRYVRGKTVPVFKVVYQTTSVVIGVTSVSQADMGTRAS